MTYQQSLAMFGDIYEAVGAVPKPRRVEKTLGPLEHLTP